MKKNILLLTLLVFAAFAANAQRSTNAKDADYSFLKGEKKINVIFDYEGMTVGKNKTETDYVAEKVAEKNEKKAGDGDRWKEAWEKGKLNVYEPAFSAKFTKRLAKKVGISASSGDDANITLIVRTTRLEPGFYSYAVNRAAEVDLELIFVETANHDNIIAQIVMSKVRGSESMTVSDRVKIAYVASATRLSQYIYKALK